MRQKAPPIRTILVGCNGYGEVLLKELLCLQVEGLVDLAAVVDPNHTGPGVQRAEAAGITHYSALIPALQEEKPEWTVVATPIHLHPVATITALEHGAHVLCEKPAAGCWDDAWAMHLAAQAPIGNTHRQVAIGFQWVFSPAVQALRTDLAAGRLGQPQRFASCVLWQREHSYFQRSPWAGQRECAGAIVNDSVLSNATAHHLHLLMHLARPPAEDSVPYSWRAALGRCHAIATCDSGIVDVDYAGIALRHCASHCVEMEWAPLFLLECELGCVHYQPGTGFAFHPHKGGPPIVYGDPEQAPLAKLRHCAQALQRQEVLPSSIAECADHLRLMEAIHSQALPAAQAPNTIHHRNPIDGGESLVVPDLAQHLLACWANEAIPPPSWMSTAQGSIPAITPTTDSATSPLPCGNGPHHTKP